MPDTKDFSPENHPGFHAITLSFSCENFDSLRKFNYYLFHGRKGGNGVIFAFSWIDQKSE
jgi:hypothetical protein